VSAVAAGRTTAAVGEDVEDGDRGERGGDPGGERWAKQRGEDGDRGGDPARRRRAARAGAGRVADVDLVEALEAATQDLRVGNGRAGPGPRPARSSWSTASSVNRPQICLRSLRDLTDPGANPASRHY
jgi:hypothetical protein